MILSEVLSSLRIELQDQSQALYKDDELIRAIEKSVSLMSRIIPKRDMVEATISTTITGETLTIASSTGTLAYKPVKIDTMSITGKTLDTDYTINYLTGVITEIGANLTDGSYTVSYEKDDAMLDIASILPDYIKTERIEYPVGQTPATYITGDIYGSYLAIRGNSKLSTGDHIRITYLKKWTAPTTIAEGDYPSHLNNAIIIGSAGQALIYKAEKYTQSAVTTLTDIVTLLATIDALVPTLTAPTAPTAPTLGSLTPPSGYTVVKPTAPTLPTAPAAPGSPTLSFTDVETDVDGVDTASTGDLAIGLAYLTSGTAYINAGTRGENVGANYANYANVVANLAQVRVNNALARLREIENTLAKYSSDVTYYGSAVNAYANEMSGVIGKYREQINAENLGVQNAVSEANVYSAQVQAQNAQVNIYQAEVTAFQAEIANIQNQINIYTGQANIILGRSAQLATQIGNYLDIAGRYLASGQAKINEMLVMLGTKAEFFTQKSSSEQFN